MKHMTKWMLVAAVLLAPVCASAGVLDGVPFTYSGTVTDYLHNGGGMVLAVEDVGDVTIYGLGPAWFWEANNVVKPSVGEVVTIEGYTYNDRNIAFTVASDVLDPAFHLRDADTGRPLWSRAQRFLRNQQKHQNRRGQPAE